MKEINDYYNDGWEKKEESKGYITLRRPYKFNWWAFIFLSILFNIFGLIGYIIYFSKKQGTWQQKVISK